MSQSGFLNFWRGWFALLILVIICALVDAQNQTENEIRPYEFAFNIVDFQHRSERKDSDGLISGEYGFITLDGIYHETEYIVDRTGDFIVTKMRHRRITDLKDAEAIFKDKPAAAKKLTEALVRACTSCDTGAELELQESASFVTAPPLPPALPVVRQEQQQQFQQQQQLQQQRQQPHQQFQPQNRPSPSVIIRRNDIPLEKKLDLAMKEMVKVLSASASVAEQQHTAGEKNQRTDRRILETSGRGFSFNINHNNDNNNNNNNNNHHGNEGNRTKEIVRGMVEAARKVLVAQSANRKNDSENERDSRNDNDNISNNNNNNNNGIDIESDGLTSQEALERMANDLFYRFNYTITSHGHREEGFRDGRKDGEFNAKFRDGVDTHVRYVSNEFGYQPNITLVARREEPKDDRAESQSTNEPPPFEGPQFFWFKK